MCDRFLVFEDRDFVRRADHEMRLAWLTVTADELQDYHDDGGLLSAQLRDLRDVLELLGADREPGWCPWCKRPGR